jgi:hypothetical protein
MQIEIESRWDSSKILWSGEAESLREAVIKAVAAGADLTGADLTDAYLPRAYLTDAYLTGADLTDAYLPRANLTDANLADANLAGANLTDAYLTGADLTRANLTGADLTGADLTGADLTGADLTDAYLTGARNVPASISAAAAPLDPVAERQRRTERAARLRGRRPDVPVVPNLDAQILANIDSGALMLDMSNWHTCETTHCRAGLAVHLAGDAGYALERRYTAEHAGRLIYLASTGYAPDFFASDEDAMEDIRRCAAEAAEGT